MALCAPWARWWGRLQVEGLEALPRSGPVLLAGNHDSNMDPVAVGVAARGHRQVRALAKASLWSVKPLAPILTGMGQIPIDRGKGDVHALDRAVEALREGACIGIFPEGTRSLGRELRAHGDIDVDVPDQDRLEGPEHRRAAAVRILIRVVLVGVVDEAGPRHPRAVEARGQHRRVVGVDDGGAQPQQPPQEGAEEGDAVELERKRAAHPPGR